VGPWLNASQRLRFPFNSSAVEGGYHPEYDGYTNETVKQADVVLLGFPLGVTSFFNMNHKTRTNDLDWYSRVTSLSGPAMTWGMFTVGYVEEGQTAKADTFFPRSYANAQEPFDVWTETPSGGAMNFLTGAGGFLQVVLFGYPGLRFNDTHATFKPTLPPDTTNLKLRGLAYRGHRLDVDITASTVEVSVQKTAAPDRLHSLAASMAATTNREYFGGNSHPFCSPDGALSSGAPDTWGVCRALLEGALSQQGRVIFPDSAGYLARTFPTAPEYVAVKPPALVVVTEDGTHHELDSGSPVVVQLSESPSFAIGEAS